MARPRNAAADIDPLADLPAETAARHASMLERLARLHAELQACIAEAPGDDLLPAIDEMRRQVALKLRRLRS